MTSQPKVIAINAKMASTCMSCEDVIYVGEEIWWCPGVGAWHRNCNKPRSLGMLWREAQQRKKAGL